MTRRVIATASVLLALLAAVGVAWAQTSPHYDLSWHVLGAGGREWMSSGSHMVHGTLGQLAIGPAASGQTSLGAGYWYGIREEGYGVYLPLVLKTFTP